MTKLDELEERIGHTFKRHELLRQAVTHASLAPAEGAGNNERLEFLGDRVLALLAADMLLERFPMSDEGGLAMRLNTLVRRETCADVGRKLDLGTHLILADSENRAGGRSKATILADACEALIGAIYLDGGLEAAREFFKSNWGALVDTLADPPRDAKTALQEWSQGLGLPPPAYRLLERSGPDHDPRFCIEVRVGGRAPSQGRGSTKKAAEHEAAAVLLAREGVWRPKAEP